MRKLFAHAQIAAYREASHGWFFWTWSDRGGGSDWDFQLSHGEGCWPESLELPLGLKKPPTPAGSPDDDLLEKVLDAPASNPRVCFGDTIYLRAFNGCDLDVEGPCVRARYGDRGLWQQFTVCPAGAVSVESAHASVGIRDGDKICLLAHTGLFIGIDDDCVVAR